MLGSFGAWYIGARHPDIFAAVVPIAGGILLPGPLKLSASPFSLGVPDAASTSPNAYMSYAYLLRDTPVWIFHGADDAAVPVTESRRMMNTLYKIGDAAARYTEFPSVPHNVWDKGYDDPLFASWLFAQRLKHDKPVDRRIVKDDH